MRLVREVAGVRAIALLGNHTPRRCGIATFTADLADALSAARPAVRTFVLAMNDAGKRYDYPSQVAFEIDEGDVDAYGSAAAFVDVERADVLSVQHEYGIFGGKSGASLLTMLHRVRVPIVTTLHTILAEPSDAQREVMDVLTRISERIVVMSTHGETLLRDVHGVPAGKIDRIPHGIPSVGPATRTREELGVDGRRVILTFGLLSPDKGLENVIEAMPAIVARCPDALYVVLGATHPHVKARHGESYRRSLQARVRALGVEGHVVFHDRFVALDELADFLGAADVYVTPYLKPEQITSGTLAYAVGLGKPVISTPYWYAREMLADDRGVLVPWRDPGAISEAVVDLFTDEDKRLALGARAAAHGRNMTWPIVAGRYLETFARARRDALDRRRSSRRAKTIARVPFELPPPSLDHLQRMTDSTGLLQHAVYDLPRREEGYCLDDNARALLLTTRAGFDPGDGAVLRDLGARYLAFVHHAFDADAGRFRNFMRYERTWIEGTGSEDSHGRALWALGAVVKDATDRGRRGVARALFHAALPAVGAFTSPRAWAYALLGMDAYLATWSGERVVTSMRAKLVARLLDCHRASSVPGWPWFEDRLTYCNARLSHALIVSGAAMRDDEARDVGLASLDWLLEVQTAVEGWFAPVGNDGFWIRGGARASFDQQPVEAHSTVEACVDAARVTGDASWGRRARDVFSWFLGHNAAHVPLHDPTTGGCRDGLHADRANENQGAESTLSFLLALADVRTLERARATAIEETRDEVTA